MSLKNECQHYHGQSVRLETMKEASDILNKFSVLHDNKIISAHRTPDRMYAYAKSAEKKY